ncbi:MAG: IPTL-CTERM sorting domain-containing protein [Bacteroidota bacterium]
MEYFKWSNVTTDIVLRAEGNAASDFNFTTSRCSEADCNVVIPTMNQWGLVIFGLLGLNLGLFSVRRRVFA